MANPIENYSVRAVEAKWQKKWDDEQSFSVSDDKNKQKYYVLEMFPYPSGRIHMGHLRNYTIGDVVARYKKAQGFNVLHPMGWDAFGLPAENAAIENNVHPAKWTLENIAYMRGQLKKIGFSYDWSREVTTCTPEYYKHEQKMFLDFVKNDLAYQKEAMVNWDPVDNTVLANEQVVDGRGWRSGAIVERKKLRQWFLRISDSADELLQFLKTLDGWPEKVKTMQERWIGKSEGLRIFFDIEGKNDKLEVYTTRPDTIFGAAFCAIAANHPIALEIAKNNPDAAKFAEDCNKMGMAEEIIEKTEKLGFDTGLKIIHPFDQSIKLPLYIANFVLMEYGTGAIFGCPAHDQRDLDFARKYNLPVKVVISADGNPNCAVQNESYTGDGVLVNSSFLDGMTIAQAKSKVCNEIEAKNQGKRTINYRLRDWGVSRQRYWGCPIPMVHCTTCGTVPVPENQLPVTLPEDVSFDKAGNPLDHHPTWKHVKCPKCNTDAVRETDTFDTFFESSWYFARYCSPKSVHGIESGVSDYWLPVDQYIGGIEHAVLHLLYARYFTLALKKCGYLNVQEPFKGILTQGMVCHETYQDKNGKWLLPDDVVKEKGKATHIKTGEAVTVGRSQKMSKSKKNVVDPTVIVDAYGADTARLFMLSDSPPERDLEWSDSGVEGCYKYLNRLWKMASELKLAIGEKQPQINFEPEGALLEVKKQIHKTIAGVTDDLDNFRLNKAVSRIRELTNALADVKSDSDDAIAIKKEGLETAILLFAPMIPHICEELWNLLGNDKMTINTPWPVANSKYLVDEKVIVAIQLNGKLKVAIELPKDCSQDEAKKAALENPKFKKALDGKEVRKIIVVPNRIVNVVI
jgi:leucyl-tRNA synthetase